MNITELIDLQTKPLTMYGTTITIYHNHDTSTRADLMHL